MDINAFRTLIYKICGSTYHRIEVPNDVFNDHIVPKCKQYFSNFHHSGSSVVTIPIELVSGQKDYILSSDILEVTEVLSGVSAINPSISPSRLYREDMLRRGITNLSDYSLSMGWLNQMRITLSPYYHFSFNKFNHVLTIQNPTQISGNSLFVEAWKNEINNSNLTGIFNDDLFRDMVTAQVYINWARQLKKYDRALLGASTLNWKELEESGNELWEKSIERLRNEESEEPEILFG